MVTNNFPETYLKSVAKSRDKERSRLEALKDNEYERLGISKNGYIKVLGICGAVAGLIIGDALSVGVAFGLFGAIVGGFLFMALIGGKIASSKLEKYKAFEAGINLKIDQIENKSGNEVGRYYEEFRSNVKIEGKRIADSELVKELAGVVINHFRSCVSRISRPESQYKLSVCYSYWIERSPDRLLGSDNRSYGENLFYLKTSRFRKGSRVYTIDTDFELASIIEGIALCIEHTSNLKERVGFASDRDVKIMIGAGQGNMTNDAFRNYENEKDCYIQLDYFAINGKYKAQSEYIK